MTPEELIAACKSGGQCVLLVLPGPPPKRGYSMRLCRTHGPRGEIINTNQHTGDSVVRFKAAEVLRFVESQPKE